MKKLAKRANILSNQHLNTVLKYVASNSQAPLRDYAALLFSFKAGLRVGEISSIKWKHVTDCSGALREDSFVVSGDVAKGGHYREVPFHPVLKATLSEVLKKHTISREEYIVPSVLDRHKKVSANTLQKYFGRLYKACGLGGCSSHSGRRTFITKAAREAVKHGCSIRDVQLLAGHSALHTTEVYIEASAFQGRLVKAL